MAASFLDAVGACDGTSIGAVTGVVSEGGGASIGAATGMIGYSGPDAADNMIDEGDDDIIPTMPSEEIMRNNFDP